MAISAFMASLFIAQAAAATPVEVAYDELSAGDAAAAIAKIERSDARGGEHPARMINLGVAYARAGRADEARAMFEAAAQGERYRLETANGDWVDSRDLARRALAKLDRGEFGSAQFARR